MTSPTKPRKHPWVTEALNAGEEVLSVYPSPDELTNERKNKILLDTLEKVGNDPRVVRFEKVAHDQHGYVVLFFINKD